jgi:hypothetical protein
VRREGDLGYRFERLRIQPQPEFALDALHSLGQSTDFSPEGFLFGLRHGNLPLESAKSVETSRLDAADMSVRATL